jgi:hypothetical protein
MYNPGRLELYLQELMMLVEARLITPEGEVVLLSPRDYRKVLQTLADRAKASGRPRREEARSLVAELRGKYAGAPSLAKVLLEEHKQEREREGTQGKPSG